jgi:hypothetical protein
MTPPLHQPIPQPNPQKRPYCNDGDEAEDHSEIVVFCCRFHSLDYLIPNKLKIRARLTTRAFTVGFADPAMSTPARSYF